ncbi:MAG: VOC family protein [Solirubrobacteraceae bacterium]|nr:VOC family protein [Patulibacter sp.]
MFKDTQTFSGFSVDDLDAAKAFYADTLGLEVEVTEMGGLILSPGTPRATWVYVKPNHEPATFTILNFQVDDVHATVRQLVERGITFERYPGMDEKQTPDGVFTGGGPLIAWFTDPAGNILSVIEHGVSA